MFARSLLLCTAAFACAAPLQAFAGPMNVKPGAWEMTTTSLTKGLSASSVDMSQIPEEHRAMMERAMQSFAGKPMTIMTKNCVTKEDLDEDRLFKSAEQENCTKKIISQSETRMVFEMTCAAPNYSKATVTAEAKSPESITSSMDMIEGRSGGKIHVDVKGRWLGASCEGIKDRN